jgi:histidyl-tRNA synthetase
VAAIGGPETPGVGFGTGVERILLAVARSAAEVPSAPAPVAYLVSMGEGTRGEVFALAHEMRTRGVVVELDYVGRSAKGQMKQAGRSGARLAVIIGEAEMAAGTVTLRDLRSGQEELMARDEVVALAQAAAAERPPAGV